MFAGAARWRWRLVEATVAASTTATPRTSGQVLVAGKSSVAAVAVQFLLSSMVVDETKLFPAVVVVPVPVVVWIPMGYRRRWRRFPDPWAMTSGVDIGLVTAATAVVIFATSRVLLMLVVAPKLRWLSVSSTSLTRALSLGA